MAFCFLANQVLGRERWARDRLAAFAGESAELRLPFLAPFVFSVAPDGRVEPGGAAPAVAVTPTGIVGTGAFADELRYLARHVRPDVEEELSKLVGDVAAHRVGSAMRTFLQWQLDAGARLGEALSAYATDERRMLVRGGELAAFARDAARLEEALERLGKRLDELA